MSQQTGRRSFGEIYREQHREVTSSRTSKIFRVITPLGLLVLSFGLIKISPVGTVVLAVAAGVLLAVAVIAGKRQRRRE